MLSFAETGEVGVDGSSHGTGVTEVDLDLSQVLTLFQEMRRVAVAQRMYMGGFLDAALEQGDAKSALQGGAVHGFGGGGAAQAALTLCGKEQARMFVSDPKLAQEDQGSLGKRDVTIAIAFAAANVEEHTLGIDVIDLQSQTFTQTQTTGVDGGQSDAMIQGLDEVEDAAGFGSGEDDGEFKVRIGTGQLHFGGPGSTESFFPEQFDGADGLGSGLAGDFLNVLEIDKVLAKFLCGNEVGGSVIMFAELAQAGPVGLLSARPEGEQGQIIGERF